MNCCFFPNFRAFKGAAFDFDAQRKASTQTGLIVGLIRAPSCSFKRLNKPITSLLALFNWSIPKV